MDLLLMVFLRPRTKLGLETIEIPVTALLVSFGETDSICISQNLKTAHALFKLI